MSQQWLIRIQNKCHWLCLSIHDLPECFVRRMTNRGCPLPCFYFRTTVPKTVAEVEEDAGKAEKMYAEFDRTNKEWKP